MHKTRTKGLPKPAEEPAVGGTGTKLQLRRLFYGWARCICEIRRYFFWSEPRAHTRIRDLWWQKKILGAHKFL